MGNLTVVRQRYPLHCMQRSIIIGFLYCSKGWGRYFVMVLESLAVWLAFSPSISSVITLPCNVLTIFILISYRYFIYKSRHYFTANNFILICLNISFYKIHVLLIGFHRIVILPFGRIQHLIYDPFLRNKNYSNYCTCSLLLKKYIFAMCPKYPHLISMCACPLCALSLHCWLQNWR